MANPLLTFNAKSVDPEILEKTMVGRKEIIDRIEKELLVKIKKNQTYQSLLVAPRGSGKTHMTRVLYNRLKTNKEIEDKIVIAYMIEDEVGIANFLDFIVRILDSFTRYSEKNSNYLKEAIYEISNRADRQEAALKNLLLDFLDGKTLVVLIENLNVIFEGMGVQGQSRLRDFIHEQNNISIIATSQNLSNVKESKYPFYNFFKTTHLQKLDFKESFDFMKSIANAEGKSTMISEFESSKMKGKIRAIYELTGGNHRLLVEFYSFLRADIKSELSQVFVKTMNSLKPYYEQFVSVLPVQQQKIVKHISLKHIPQKGKDIARSCFMQQNTASKQLSELYKKGYLDKHKEGKETFYELREPLMRICFEIGESPDGIAKLFINFLSIIYSSEEIKSKFLKNKYAAKLKPLEIREKYQLEAQMMGKALDTETLKELLNLPELEKCVSENEVEEKIEEYNSKRFEKEHGIGKDELLTLIRNSILFDDNYKKDLIVSITELNKHQINTLKNKVLAEKELFEKVQLSDELLLELHLCLRDGQLDIFNVDFLYNLSKNKQFENDYSLYCILGIAYLDTDNTKDAIIAFEKSLLLNPQSYASFQYLGEAFFKSGKYEDAILNYKMAAELKQDDENNYFNIGMAYFKLKQFHNSILAFRSALKINPNNDTAYLNIAKNFFNLQEYEESIIAIQKLISFNPNNALAFEVLGMIQMKISNFKEAEISFKEAILIDNKDFEAYDLLGYCLMELGRFKESIQFYRKGIEEKQNPVAIYDGMGCAYIKMRNFKEAKKVLKKGLTLDNEHKNLKLNLLHIYIYENDIKNCQSLFYDILKTEDDTNSFEDHMSEDLLVPLLNHGSYEFSISFLPFMKENLVKTKQIQSFWKAFPTAIFEVLVNFEDYDLERLTWIEEQLDTFFGEEKKMKISLLMLNVGIRYLKKNEKQAIYDLSKEERKVFQEFVLDKRK